MRQNSILRIPTHPHKMYPDRESNSNLLFRRELFYPLNYQGNNVSGFQLKKKKFRKKKKTGVFFPSSSQPAKKKKNTAVQGLSLHGRFFIYREYLLLIHFGNLGCTLTHNEISDRCGNED